MASKGMTFSVKPDQVMATSIRRTKDGYNSAAMVVRLGEGEYMTIDYSWQGDAVTDIAMDFMGFISANKEEIEASIEEHSEEHAEYAKKKKGGGGC